MPNVDKNAPLVTNSDAAMWRQDHASAIRYIEALLAERESWAPVMEAAEARQRAWLSYQNAPGFSAERDRLRGGIHARRRAIRQCHSQGVCRPRRAQGGEHRWLSR